MRVDAEEIRGLILTCGLSDLERPFPELNGNWFLVTATKSRARDMERIPTRTIGLIEITDDGAGLAADSQGCRDCQLCGVRKRWQLHCHVQPGLWAHATQNSNKW